MFQGKCYVWFGGHSGLLPFEIWSAVIWLDGTCVFGVTDDWRIIPVSYTPQKQWKNINHLNHLNKVGRLPVINGVITPISRVITPVTHL